MDHISTLLSRALAKRGLKDQAYASLVVYHAQCWLTEHLSQLADVIRVLSFKDGTLSIKCEHSIAAQECQLLIEELKAYLREEHGEDAPKTIRLIR